MLVTMLADGGISPVVTGFGVFPLHSSSVGCLLLETGAPCPSAPELSLEPGWGNTWERVAVGA